VSRNLADQVSINQKASFSRSSDLRLAPVPIDLYPGPAPGSEPGDEPVPIPEATTEAPYPDHPVVDPIPDYIIKQILAQLHIMPELSKLAKGQNILLNEVRTLIDLQHRETNNRVKLEEFVYKVNRIVENNQKSIIGLMDTVEEMEARERERDLREKEIQEKNKEIEEKNSNVQTALNTVENEVKVVKEVVVDEEFKIKNKQEVENLKKQIKEIKYKTIDDFDKVLILTDRFDQLSDFVTKELQATSNPKGEEIEQKIDAIKARMEQIEAIVKIKQAQETKVSVGESKAIEMLEEKIIKLEGDMTEQLREANISVPKGFGDAISRSTLGKVRIPAKVRRQQALLEKQAREQAQAAEN